MPDPWETLLNPPPLLAPSIDPNRRSDRRNHAVVRVDGDTVVVEAPFALKDALKTIRSRAWDGNRKAWTYPATPAACGELYRVLDAAGVAILDDPAFRDLARADEQGHAVLAGILPGDRAPIRPDAPPMFRHQALGAALIEARGCCYLGHDMGAGKTRTVIEAAEALGLRRVVVLAPLAVVGAWPRQWARWGRPETTVLGLDDGSIAERTKRARAALDETRGPLVLVLNYDAAWREPMAGLLLGQTWDLAVADEVHKIKEPGRGAWEDIERKKARAAEAADAARTPEERKRALAAGRTDGVISVFCAALAKRAARRVGLSGTPIPNSPFDLWAQCRFVDRGLLEQNYGAFHVRHAIKGGYRGKATLGFKDEEGVGRLFARIAHRVRKEDVLDLPPETEEDRYVILGDKTRKAYREVEEAFVATLPDDLGTISVPNVLVELLRLGQLAGGHATTDAGTVVDLGSEKEDALREFLEDLPRDEPVAVFCRFTPDVQAVHRAARAAGRGSLELSGASKEHDLWQARTGQPTVLAVQIQAGGLGVELTRARYAVFYSIGYSPAELDQAKARLHRTGQTRPVVHVYLVARDTVDEGIREAIENKTEIVETVLRHLKGAK